MVLHVVGQANAEVFTQNGRQLPQMVLDVPQKVKDRYQQLIVTDNYPPCYAIIPQLSNLMMHSWMSRLQTERLERKTHDILQRVKRCDGSWESAFFVTMARNYGFGVNSDAFETWAYHLPLQQVAHHRDDLFQIEALFMGQAGLLDEQTIPECYRQEALQEGYFNRLAAEYRFLAHKFQWKPMPSRLWRYLRLRPQNFPHIRISQLATLYHSRKSDLSRLLECATIEQVKTLLATHVTPYWETHYTFGSTSCTTAKNISDSSLNLLVINTAVPMLFAYGRHRNDEKLCDRALGFLEQLKAENNRIVRLWQQCGLVVHTAGDSQALIQLKKEYCDRKDCLRCRIGYEFLKR